MNAPLFYISQLLGYRIFRWLFNFTFSWLFNFTKFWWYKVTYYTGFNPRPTLRTTNTNNTPTNAFQSTPPREGRPHLSWTFRWASMFQSTPPREGRRKKRPIYKARLGFNPRPHTRGDIVKWRYRHTIYVSIHAPTRGATWAQEGIFSTAFLFQSTPPREGQLWAHDQYIAPNLSFNPRPHTRGDTLWLCEHQALHVSIHAPTRGATRLAITAPFHAVFQSTPPHEGRHFLLCSITQMTQVSIHAPTRGATHLLLQLLTLQSMFQSTPPREGRRTYCCNY